MSCLRPIKIIPSAYRGTSKERTSCYVDCRKCPPCRAKQAREWTKRMKDELTLHPYASFVTLTYAPKCLPSGGNLFYPDVQLFLKRLRVKVARDSARLVKTIRFFCCGEYGPNDTHRPHYHLIIYGLDPGYTPDVNTCGGLISFAGRCTRRQTEMLLEESWDRGRISVDTVNDKVIGYVANYLQKKDVYVPLDRVLPFHRQSTNPGIGYGYALKWQHQIVDKGTYMVLKSPESPCLPSDKPKSMQLPYPAYYYRKMLTDDQIEQRRKDMIAKAIADWVMPYEIDLYRLKTPDDLQDFIWHRKLHIQRVNSMHALVKKQFFGIDDSRQKLDYHEQFFGLPVDKDYNPNEIPKPAKKVNYVISKKHKKELVPKIRALFSTENLELDVNTEDLTWHESEALERAQRKRKMKRSKD